MKGRGSHLQYDWWRYLLVAFLAVILWNSVFDMLAQPKDNEKISICYFGENFYAEQCEEALNRSLNQYTNQALKEITAELRGSGKDAMLTRLVETGVYASDLMVFEQGAVADQVLQSYINRLDTQKLEAYFASTGMKLTYYYVDDVPYGVVMDAVPGYSGTKGCIVCLSPDSVNLGSMYGKGNLQDDAALAALRCWMEEMT